MSGACDHLHRSVWRHPHLDTRAWGQLTQSGEGLLHRGALDLTLRDESGVVSRPACGEGIVGHEVGPDLGEQGRECALVMLTGLRQAHAHRAEGDVGTTRDTQTGHGDVVIGAEGFE